ncbi:hypothetical protein MPSI1_002091 [Malassezia psittaci]|uniref:Uncharacterized protein n=1 Tax=Malassezia psittaci TaxID=1821823 RepID=A0AAF0FBI3_9BASI|nr:hypothetical protein MPSI1_002091 [Malassezia psittaci]
MYVFSLGASFVLLVLVLAANQVAYLKRKWILAQLSEPTRHRVQAILGAQYSPLSRFDWNTAAEVGLTSALFDIEANITDGDTREGLDEHGMHEVHQLMQKYNLSFDEARLRRHRALLSQNNIDPLTGMPLDSKAVTRL